MQLSFLGKSYEASRPAIDGTDTSETGKFLGNNYGKKSFNVAQSHQPSEELKFLGRTYTR